jgi:hypothetical protein
MTSHQLGKEIEQWFSEQCDFQIDFEIADALAKLERFRIVKSKKDLYTAQISAAQVELDSQWHGLFSFSKTSLSE